MPELTPAQIETIKRLLTHDFTPTSFKMYTEAIGVRRGRYAALLKPSPDGELRLLGEPCYLIDDHLTVRIQSDGRLWFVWKSQRVEATEELLRELNKFSRELADLLPPSPGAGPYFEPRQ
jgi:hypothetical protein